MFGLVLQQAKTVGYFRNLGWVSESTRKPGHIREIRFRHEADGEFARFRFLVREISQRWAISEGRHEPLVVPDWGPGKSFQVPSLAQLRSRIATVEGL